MWGNDYGNAGGFDTIQSGCGADTPGGQKPNRPQNLVPVLIGDILCASEEGFAIEEYPVGMVEFVGIVKNVDAGSSKTTYIIDDDSGSISAVHWTDGEKAVERGEDVSEGMNVRVIGVVRSQKGEKHIMVFRIFSVEGKAEVDAHKLGVVLARLKMKQLVDKEKSAIGVNPLSNSMVCGFGVSSGFSFPNPKHESVFKMLQGSTIDEGLHRNELMERLKGQMSKKDLDDALSYLSDEGHIFSTMDEDHFKTTCC